MPVRPERLFFSNANESTADPRGRGSPKRDSSKGIMKTVRDKMVFATGQRGPCCAKRYIDESPAATPWAGCGRPHDERVAIPTCATRQRARGSGSGRLLAQRGFRLLSGQRRGDHDANAYLACVNAMRELVRRLSEAYGATGQRRTPDHKEHIALPGAVRCALSQGAPSRKCPAPNDFSKGGS